MFITFQGFPVILGIKTPIWIVAWKAPWIWPSSLSCAPHPHASLDTLLRSQCGPPAVVFLVCFLKLPTGPWTCFYLCLWHATCILSCQCRLSLHMLIQEEASRLPILEKPPSDFLSWAIRCPRSIVYLSPACSSFRCYNLMVFAWIFD